MNGRLEAGRSTTTRMATRSTRRRFLSRLHTASDSGTLQAAFDGTQGRFWRNRSNNEVTVTLKTSGDYQQIKRVL
jgi:hypothetical protein